MMRYVTLLLFGLFQFSPITSIAASLIESRLPGIGSQPPVTQQHDRAVNVVTLPIFTEGDYWIFEYKTSGDISPAKPLPSGTYSVIFKNRELVIEGINRGTSELQFFNLAVPGLNGSLRDWYEFPITIGRTWTEGRINGPGLISWDEIEHGTWTNSLKLSSYNTFTANNKELITVNAGTFDTVVLTRKQKTDNTNSDFETVYYYSPLSKSAVKAIHTGMRGKVAELTLIRYGNRSDDSLRRLADEGNAEAQRSLGLMYFSGRGVPRDNVEAARWFHKSAEQGNALAQFRLGILYSAGQGVTRDDAEAGRWFRKAAGQGIPEAQFSLGVMYYHGQGLPQDDREALDWFQAASKNNYPLAQFSLGVMYVNGRGVTRDDAEAVKWFRKAAEQGNALAQSNLGTMYVSGRGVTRDDAEAVRWFRKAAEQGNAPAQSKLGQVYASGRGVTRDDAEAVRWFRKAAEQGDAPAQTHLGAMYVSGRGVMRDDAEAVKWYRKAAEQGEPMAQFNLGLKYAQGSGGLPQDFDVARMWLSRAAAQGNQSAKSKLSELETKTR